MKLVILFLLSVNLLFSSGKEIDSLDIKKINENIYIHISYIDLEKYGPFPCNGLIYKNNNEVIIFDTPMNNKSSRRLISWIRNELKCKIKAIVINHFHDDAIGGLEAFHEEKIPSYASDKTIQLAKENDKTVPLHSFKDVKNLNLNNELIINKYIGPAHTEDNIISYIPSQKLLFGGCMVKEMNASKGYLGDANLDEWSNTMQKIIDQYPDLEIIIPGHGEHGGMELLEYTKNLFSKNKKRDD